MSAAQVALLLATRELDRPLDYAVPAALVDRVVPGAMVACPLGRRVVLGVVVGRDPATFEGDLIELAGVVDTEPISTPLVELASWIAGYYLAPVAACLRLVLPPGAEGTLRRRPDGSWRLIGLPGPRTVVVAHSPGTGGSARQEAILDVLRAHAGEMTVTALCDAAGTTAPTLRRMAERGLLVLDRRETGTQPDAVVPDTPPTLNPEQASAVADIDAARERGQAALLLHGVTGSGKTEVYLRAIEAARAHGRGAIVLAPEIALTPQLADRLRRRLGERVALWHSGLTDAERAREDRRVRSGEADVVLGARSAVFAPVANLGLIIVDEEHESSYKQDASPRYDARQVAYRRGRLEDALVVYGSATPRPESWWALPRLTLANRADGAPLPPIRVVDMRTQPAGPISRPLATALQDATARGEKAIILLNRRGLARMVLCHSCGWVGRCPRCDVPLVVHGRPERAMCHHCGWEASVPQLCPRCSSTEIGRQGTGTQGVEAALAAVIPDVRVVRLDGDVIARRGELDRRLQRFSAPGAAVLVGTQMVAKGHDLPAITVAAVLDADGALQQPSFRAEERAFGLMVQLAGRAGRRGEPATVLFQAWEPDGRAVRLGARHAVEEFLAGEIASRRELGFPPFGHLVRLVVDGADRDPVERVAQRIAAAIPERAPDVLVFGPSRLHRVRGRSRRAVLLRGERVGEVTTAVTDLLAGHERRLGRLGVRVVIDVDPQET